MRVIIPLLLFAICACSPSTNDPSAGLQSETTVVKSIIASPSNYLQREFVALATPTDVVNLAFKISGQILSIPISTGDLVAKGQLLAQLDRRDFDLQLSADRAEWEQAQSRLERVQRLLLHQAVSQQEVESAESAYKRTESAYEYSLQNLAETSLTAPFQSVVEQIYADPYQRIVAGESIVRLVSPTTSQVAFTLPESLLDAMSNPETHFYIRFDNIPSMSFEASIKDYARTTSNASGFPVTLLLENPDPQLFRITSGMSCIVTMVTPQGNDKSVVIPLSAIYAPSIGGTYVWVIGANNRISLRPVELLAPTGQSSVIVKGEIESGERVVSAGVYKLQDGQQVTILN